MNVPLDPENPEQFFGPKTVMQPPFVWEDWYGIITCGILLIPIALLLIYLIMRICDNKPIIRKVKVEPEVTSASDGDERNRAYQRGKSMAKGTAEGVLHGIDRYFAYVY